MVSLWTWSRKLLPSRVAGTLDASKSDIHLVTSDAWHYKSKSFTFPALLHGLWTITAKVCASEGNHEVEGAWGNSQRSAEDVVNHLGHSKGHPEIGIIKSLDNTLLDFPPDGLAAWITNWTGGTNVSDF